MQKQRTHLFLPPAPAPTVSEAPDGIAAGAASALGLAPLGFFLAFFPIFLKRWAGYLSWYVGCNKRHRTRKRERKKRQQRPERPAPAPDLFREPAAPTIRGNPDQTPNRRVNRQNRHIFPSKALQLEHRGEQTREGGPARGGDTTLPTTHPFPSFDTLLPVSLISRSICSDPSNCFTEQ